MFVGASVIPSTVGINKEKHNSTNNNNSFITKGVRDTTTVSIDPPSQTVSPGETFTVDVYCIPGQPIKLFELKLSFDPFLLQANSVTEGDIFDGYTTFFNSGTINNTTGNIVDVFGLIMGSGNVSDPGTFATISFTATSALGSSTLDLYDVGVANETGYVSITVNDGSVTVMTFVWVDDDFNSSTPGWNITHFDNIQDGIEAINESGTVFVYNGTYYENVIIDKTINLIGEDRNTTIIDGGGSGDVVYVSADWVNISGFTIRNSGSGSSQEDAGFQIISDYNTISSNNISNNYDSIFLDSSSNHNNFYKNDISNNYDGFFIIHSSNNNTIYDNYISNNSDFGIIVWNSNNNTIYRNLISNNDGGVDVCASHNVISNNIISMNNLYSIIIYLNSNNNIISGNNIFSNNGNGIDLHGDSENNTISGNNISDNDAGIFLREVSKNTISGNTIYSNNGDGIEIEDSSYNTIKDNNISSNDNDGVYILSMYRHSSNNTINSNTINNNNNHGISLENYSNNYYSDNNIIYHNNLINNTQNAYDECNNIWNDSYPSGGNYFDDYLGVDNHHGQNQDIPGADGIGDTPYNISGGNNQDNYPFINPWNGTSPVPPLDTVFVDDDYNESTPGWGYDRFNSIQYGINEVKESGTVYVYNGTYYENVVVGKTINLTGEDRNNTIIDGGGDRVVYVSADWVNISGFTIRNGSYDGIYIGSNYNNITGNYITNNGGGISLRDSSNYNTITGNNISSNYDLGIYLDFSSNNNITGNTISNNGGGIGLESSSDNTITGNTILNNGVGIGLEFTSNNNNISGNNISLSNYYGINLDHSGSNTITGNTISSNYRHGIYLRDCYSIPNTITGNNISSNYRHGIQLECSSNNVISENNIFSNEWNGIYSYDTCNNNNISGNNITSNNGSGLRLGSMGGGSNTIMGNNICSNNGDGIMIMDLNSNTISGNTICSNNGDGIILYDFNNTVTDNNISSNNGDGIEFFDSSSNTITGNNINSNSDYGLYLHHSSNNNIIYHNNLIKNIQNSYDECSNTWDNGYPSGGNYWDDYNNTDIDGDGIGDTPYNISGDNNQDLYPLGYFHPLANFTYSVNDLTMQFNASTSYDPDGYITQYTFDFGDNTSGAGIILNHTYGNYGTYNVTLTVTDNDGKNDTISKDVTLVDLIPPGISNVQAIPSTQIHGGYVNVSATVVDNVEVDEVYLYVEYPDSIIVKINSKQRDAESFVSKQGIIENFSITQNKTGDIYYCNKTYNQIGVYTYHLWANDTSGNHNISTDYTFEIINQPPYIPSNPIPEDNATDVTIANLTLIWSGGDPDVGDVLQYDVYFGDAPNPPLFIGILGVPYNQTPIEFELYKHYELEYNTTYFWKIKARDNHGESTEGPIWNFITAKAPEPDLYCEGSLSWTSIAPGSTISDFFTIENIGEPDSLLDWEIAGYPDWGDWTFIPSSGVGLTPEDGEYTVGVTVTAPDEQNTEFTGTIRIVNMENSSDFCTIDVTLATPRNKPFFYNSPLFS